MSLKSLIDGKEEEEGDGSVLSDSSRARLDSVVTRPAALANKAGKGRTLQHKLVNWLLGKNAPSGRGYRGYILSWYGWNGWGSERGNPGRGKARGSLRRERSYGGHW
jgi:hypothetical protein